jgi:membrane-associated phospholipid phosphatase
MDEHDEAAGWRRFQRNWIPIGLMSAVLALCLAVTGFSIELSGLAFSLGFVALYGGFAYANAYSKSRRDPQVIFVLGSIAQIVLVTVVMSPLTYVAAATNLPLRDAELLALDRSLGLDWAAFAAFVNEHPVLSAWLDYGYGMIRWPLFAIPVVLTAARRYGRLQDFTLAFALALMATTVVSALVPAVGVYQQIGLDPSGLEHLNPQAYLDQVRDLAPVREGALRHLDLFGLAGIVTFPSFHAASAVLYGWALWPVRWMRPIALIANAAMLASTPIDGGHYFSDLLAGVAVAVVSIVVACRLGRAAARAPAAGGDAFAGAAAANAVPGE